MTPGLASPAGSGFAWGQHQAIAEHPMIQMQKQPTDPKPTGHGGHGGHGLMMIACCIPMLILAVILVAIGAVSPSFLFVAIACTAMMVLMMRGMRGDSSNKATDSRSRDEDPSGPQFDAKGHDYGNLR